MSVEPSGNKDNEIVNNPKRFDYNDMKLRRSDELDSYDIFFGIEESSEFSNDMEAYFDGIF